MATCLISVGSNLGDRHELLRRATESLRLHAQIEVVKASRVFETHPVGGPAGQGDFLNAALRIETSLAPLPLLDELQRIEQQLSRLRAQRWGPRTIDLDLLLHDETVIETDRLTVPHPRMAFRRFVLEPAREVAPDMMHPLCHWTVAQLCDHLDLARPYLALAGPIGVGKTSLAHAILAQIHARLVLEQIDANSLDEFYSDPAGLAWHTEIEFLKQRKRLLAECLAKDKETLCVSDFWFEQSLVFARQWLPDERWAEFETKWHIAREDVPTPKLTVYLDAPAEILFQRIRNRGRSYEEGLQIEFLERLRSGFRGQIQASGGPVLFLSTKDPDTSLIEILAAIQAMA